MGRMSVATIDAPEFININSINPLISECEIKVLYVGANRNRSYIDRNAATAIGRTLPGSPIVGYYKKDKKDFSDHGQQIIFDDEGMKINDLTRPYGFVPTDAKVWFQKFVDTDEFGNEIIREYLMTVGYLWTGQYEEAQRVYESSGGNPQSMKLDDKSVKGHWSENIKEGVNFFIINDAIIQNLCILGEDVEPCFEGADITAPKLSSSFSKDNNFVTTLFSMMKELKDALNTDKGGLTMPEIENKSEEVVQDVVETVTPVVEEVQTEVVVEQEKIEETQDKVDEVVIEENQNITEEFAKNSDEDDKKDEKEDSTSDEKEKEPEDKKDEDDEEKDKNKYQLLETQYNELQVNYSALETKYQELVNFKNQVENEKKDALIESFYMLSDEDKKDVIENKSSYSLDDIEAKLSILCVRNKVNFNKEEESNNSTIPMTYNLENVSQSTLPAWLQAVEATKKRNN